MLDTNFNTIKEINHKISNFYSKNILSFRALLNEINEFNKLYYS